MYKRQAEKSFSCPQYVFIIIDQIGHVSIQYNRQLNLRMPVPGKFSRIKPGKTLITDQHRKCIISMGFQMCIRDRRIPSCCPVSSIFS